ncbi:MAG: glutamate synthase domain-containing protein 2 [Flavobacteriales bacterium]|jgi:glutamate synthase domain-containing protein 2
MCILTFLIVNHEIKWWYCVLAIILIVLIHDLFFVKKHTILRNFPVIGHLRYLLEKAGPELRQYIVANNREELPFNRSQRSWIYASSKKENNYEGFGSDQDQTANNYLFIKNNMFPYKIDEGHPNHTEKDFIACAKVMGPQRRKPFRPRSIINISAMSYGSLSAPAVEALNKGAMFSGCYQNTGEGGLSPYHKMGADVVFHFGTGYFGVRNNDGTFSMEKMRKLIEANPCVRAIEVKLSQGAKPGKGGVLPASKIDDEIAEIRNVKKGQDVISPASHSAFSTVEEMVHFVEGIAEATGLPVGIKAAIGKTEMWSDLASFMSETGKGPDFITIDGGEGGTGAAPPSFAHHVALPFVFGFTEIYKIFQEHDLEKKTVFIGSGKLGFPSKAAMAFALGADLVNVAREAMMSIGCIQAQSCHNNTCPAGVATQNKWLQRGLVVSDKSERAGNYFQSFRKEFVEITHSAGYEHPCQFMMSDLKMNTSDHYQSKNLDDIFNYTKTEVPFSGMSGLKSCKYLGAEPKPY